MTPLPAEDVRDKMIGLLVTDKARTRTLTRLQAEAERRGETATGLAREILLAGYQGTTRRKVNRRPNQQPRHGREPDMTRLMIKVSADEHAHIARHAADNGTTITEWAWTELALAMKPQRPNRKRQDASG